MTIPTLSVPTRCHGCGAVLTARRIAHGTCGQSWCGARWGESLSVEKLAELRTHDEQRALRLQAENEEKRRVKVAAVVKGSTRGSRK